ncbi:MAG: cytochrome C [Rhodospirillales bacterium]|nr:cytochrome C [Rhodospirillales bacterium]
MRKEFKTAIIVSCAAGAACLLAGLYARPAEAVPSFARQTGMNCPACHTNFPQLTPFGRQFKAHGYLLTNNGDSWNKGFLDENNLPHLAFMALGGFTHTDKGQPGGAARGFDNNDNWALDQLSFFYGGIVVPDLVGAFVQGTYNGPNNQDAYWSWDNVDVRAARDTTVAGQELVVGLTGNNNPTVQDLWNTTPAWSFPYSSSSLAPAPAASTLIQGTLAQQVAGTGVYAMLDQRWYAELDAYYSIPKGTQRSLGLQKQDVNSEQQIDGAAPYWRLAYQEDWGDQNVEVGTFGLSAPIYPSRIHHSGHDWFTDLGFDSQYQWLSDPSTVVVTASLIDEIQRFDASEKLGISSRSDGNLYSVGINAMYMYDKTYAGTIGFTNWIGNKNPDYYGTNNGSPDSNQWIFQVDWLPFNRDGVPGPWSMANLKLSLQYAAYTKFDGTSRNASDNNTLFLNGWLDF